MFNEHFSWIGETEIVPDVVSGGNGSDRVSALEEAKKWLFDVLALEGPLPAKEVLKQSDEIGISSGTLRRAREALGVITKKESDQWVWSLPQGDQDDQENLCTPCTPSNE